MRVRMKATLSGTRDGEPWPSRGETVDLPKAEAQHLVNAGLAEEHTEATPLEETATPADEAEKAVPARRRGQSK